MSHSPSSGDTDQSTTICSVCNLPMLAQQNIENDNESEKSPKHNDLVPTSPNLDQVIRVPVATASTKKKNASPASKDGTKLKKRKRTEKETHCDETKEKKTKKTRKLNGYMLFSKEQHKLQSSDEPFAEKTKRIANMWKGLEEQDRQRYKTSAEQLNKEKAVVTTDSA